MHQSEDLVQSLVDDVGQKLPLGAPRALAGHRRELDGFVRIHQRLVGHTPALLEALRVRLRHLEALHDVAGYARAPKRARPQEPDLAVPEDGRVRRATTQLYQSASQLLFLLRQHRERRREGLQHDVRHAITCALHRLP